MQHGLMKMSHVCGLNSEQNRKSVYQNVIKHFCEWYGRCSNLNLVPAGMSREKLCHLDAGTVGSREYNQKQDVSFSKCAT